MTSSLVAILVLIAALSWTGLSIALAIARTGESRAAVLLLNAFVGGTLVLVLVLQLEWQIGSNVRTATPIVLAVASAINVWMIAQRWRQGWRPLLAVGPDAAGLWALSVTALLLSLVSVNHAGPYYGRAWGDQLNYSLIANYLQHEPPTGGRGLVDVPARAVVVDGALLSDRVGQSFLHAWVSETVRAPALETFYLTSVIGVLLMAAVAYLCGLALGLPPPIAGLSAVAVAMSPPAQAIHLESFLSQCLATPVLIYALFAMSQSLTTNRRIWLVLTALTSAFVFAVYFEYTSFLIVGGAAVVVTASLTGRADRRQSAGAIAALALGIAAGVLLNPDLLRHLGRIVGLPGFQIFFPWAFTWEGAARLLIGDLVLWAAPALVIATAGVAVAVTGAGLAALGAITLRGRVPLAGGLAAAAALPLGVALLPGEHSYPFYKLLQSFWPLTLLGLASLLARPTQSRSRATRSLAWMAAAGMATLLISSGTRMLVVEAAGETARSGMNGYLRVYGDAVMRRLVAGRPERALVINTPRRQSFKEMIANGIAVLQLDGTFDVTQAKWLQIGDRPQALPETLTLPGRPDLPTVRSVREDLLLRPRELLLLQVGSSYLRPAPAFFTEIRSHGRMRLLKPAGLDWIVPSTVVEPFTTDFSAQDDRVAVGNDPEHYLRIDLESARDVPAGVTLSIAHDLPADSPVRVWHVYSDYPWGRAFPNTAGTLSVNSGPLRRGVTSVYLGPRIAMDHLDRPDEAALRVTIRQIIYGPA